MNLESILSLRNPAKPIRLSNNKRTYYSIPGVKRKLRLVFLSINNGINTFLPYGWVALLILSSVGIIIIGFTNIRIGHFENAKHYNDILLAISVSVFVSCVFYLVNEVAPKRELHLTMKAVIGHELDEIHELIHQCVVAVKPKTIFHLDAIPPRWIPKKSIYLDHFKKYDFFKEKIAGEIAWKYFEKREKLIKEKGLTLLKDYNRYLTIKQIHYLRNIITSPFILQGLKPDDFEVEEEFKGLVPNNQEEIGESLYRLYKKRVPK